MSEFRNYCKSLFHGENSINMHSSFKLLLRTILIIYLVYGIIFIFCGPIHLAIISFIFIIFAHLNLRLFFTKRYVLSFILTDIEILLYTLINSFLLNYDCGFSLYSLALIPLLYFVSYSLKKNGRYILNPTPLAFASCFTFIFCKFLQNFNPLNLSIRNLTLSIIIYFFNAVIVLIIIIEVCKVFSREANKRQASLEKENTQLDFYANQDPLTKLQNRRYLELKLNEAYAKANESSFQFSMLMCDIDNFKHINDTYGHISGDSVLKNVSQLIQSNIRDFDCAARWGGEEFIILIKGGIPIASLIAERINKAVDSALVPTENGDIHYTITIGVSVFKKGMSCSDLIDKSDENLYIGKRSGKNCIIY